MREIKEHPPFDIKGQIEENERVKESKAFISEKLMWVSKALVSN